MNTPKTNEPISLNLGAGEETIVNAENELGVKFPEQLIEIWKISNGLELPGGWVVHPVFDKSNPRKTSNHIVYENTKGRWSYMPESLISVAGNGTGNQLVLQIVNSEVKPDVYVWNHETNKIKKWSKSLDYVKENAQRRVSKINAQIQKGIKTKTESCFRSMVEMNG